jgi:predicted transcriptional regulator
MREVKLDLTKPVPIVLEEDDETLAAIDHGARDADEGRLTPIDEVEKMLPKWISKFSSPTKR